MNPFTLLPVEIVVRILLAAQALWPDQGKKIAPWIRLAAVCSGWRTIVLGTAAFWTVIEPPYTERFIRLALQRSGSHLIHRCTIDYNHLPPISHILLSHSNRFALLGMWPQSTSSLADLANFSFSKIHHLALFFDRERPPLVAQTFHTSLHLITTLSLRGVAVPIPALSNFRSIRRLSMEYSHYRSVYAIPFLPFLDMLRGLDLRELIIDARFSNEPYTDDRPSVDLPNLALLRLESHTPDVAVFLSALCTVSLRRFQVTAYEHPEDDDVVVGLLTNIYRFALAMQISTPRTLAGGAFSPHPYDSVVEISHKISDHQYFLLTLQSHRRKVAQLLATVTKRLTLNTVGKLQLNAYSLDRNHVDPRSIDTVDDWKALLRVLPYLRHLAIDSCGVLLDALPEALRVGRDYYPCPALALISFSEGGFFRYQCQAWYDHLLGRRFDGFPVNTLRFYRWSFPRYSVWINTLQDVCNEVQAVSTYEHIFAMDEMSPRSDPNSTDDDDYPGRSSSEGLDRD